MNPSWRISDVLHAADAQRIKFVLMLTDEIVNLAGCDRFARVFELELLVRCLARRMQRIFAEIRFAFAPQPRKLAVTSDTQLLIVHDTGRLKYNSNAVINARSARISVSEIQRTHLSPCCSYVSRLTYSCKQNRSFNFMASCNDSLLIHRALTSTPRCSFQCIAQTCRCCSC